MKKLLEKDWEFVRAAVPVLQDYLLSQQLYWPSPLSSTGGMASGEFTLTLGNVLLSLQRLQAAALAEDERESLEGIATQMAAVREHWRSHWDQKAQHEYRARLGLWLDYLEDLQGGKERFHSSYPHAVRWRAILQLLDAEANTLEPGLKEALAGLDHRLRAMTLDGPFVWAEELRSGFPAERYWFLYRGLQARV